MAMAWIPSTPTKVANSPARRSPALQLANGIAIGSMGNGKGSRRDNDFVERLCKSVKYEEVYLRV